MNEGGGGLITRPGGNSNLHRSRVPLVSVVIPAHNEENNISKVLEAMGKQDYPKYEVIVVDDASNDQTAVVASAVRGVRVVRHDIRRGLAGSLNDGIAEANGEIVVTLHADCIPRNSDWLSNLVKGFDSDDVVAVTSKLTIDSTRLKTLDKAFAEVYLPGEPATDPTDEILGEQYRPVEYMMNKCDAYRRHVLVNIGGFDESFIVSGEDADLSARFRRLNLRMRLANSAIVIQSMSSHQLGFRAHLSKAVQYGLPQASILRRHGFCVRVDSVASVFLLLYLALLYSLWRSGSVPALFVWLASMASPIFVGALVRLRGPSFLSETTSRKSMAVSVSGIVVLSGTLLVAWFSYYLEIPILVPGFLLFAVLLGPAGYKSSRYLHNYQDPSGTILTLGVYAIWSLLYGLAFWYALAHLLMQKPAARTRTCSFRA